jgi:ATP-dependent helicase HrpB
MLIAAGEHGLTDHAARIALLLGERGLGGNDADLDTRLARFARDRSPRSTAAARLAERWSRLAGGGRDGSPAADATGLCVALAFPDRLARRRGGKGGGDYASVGGRGFRLDPADPLAGSEWLAVAEVQGAAQGARIINAAAIEAATVERLFGAAIETERVVRFDAATGTVVAERRRRLGAITLARGPDANADPAAIAAALLDGVRARGLDGLPWPDDVVALRARVGFARAAGFDLPDLSDAALLDSAEAWLAPALLGSRRLDAIAPDRLRDGIAALLDWEQTRSLDQLAPKRFTTPAGTGHAIDYSAEAGPTVQLRVQELFGLTRHPTIMDGRVPLVLSLTSPAHRPIQTTRDLPAFWAGSWVAVAKEMRGRYPRHPWPDDPAAAAPTTRTKRADARRS